MRIVIVGAGFTGIQLARNLINEKNQVSLIDNEEENVRHVVNQLDCTVICADGNNLETLEEVGIAKADAIVCVTSSDEVNMITCSLVDTVYPNVLKIARVRNYAYYVNTTAAELKHSSDFSGKHRPLYGIDYMIHPDIEAADAIVQSIENGAVGSVLTFDNSDLEIARIKVEKGSSIDGCSLRNSRNLTNIHFLVAYVEKDGKSSLPSGNTVLSAEIILGVLISKKDIQKMLELCGSEQKVLRKIALIGAGRIGSIVAEKIIKPQKKITFRNFLSDISNKKSQDIVIIDSDEALAKSASEKFPDTKVFRADASDESFLREEGIDSFDLAVCITHNHELNMVLAAYLESLGVKQTISLVTSSAFSSIAQKLGIDVSIPLRDCVVDSIMSHLRGKSVKEIHTVTNGDLEIVECVVDPKSKVSGKQLREIPNLGEFLVLLKKSSDAAQFEIATGTTQLYSGDHIVLISQSSESKKVLSHFSGSN